MNNDSSDPRRAGVLTTTEDRLGRTIYWDGFKRVSRREWMGPGWFKVADAKGKVIPPGKLWDVVAAAKKAAKKQLPKPMKGKERVPVLQTIPIS